MRYFFLQFILPCTLLFSCASCDGDTSSPPTSSSLLSNTTESANTQTSEINNEFWTVDDCDISHVDTHKKLVALTFDDGPSFKLERLLSIFAAFNEDNPDCIATATLFCNGHLLTSESFTSVSMAYALGWELGNHSYSHADFHTLSIPQVQDEIQTTDELLQKIDGKTKHIFRPPFGNLKTEQKHAIQTPIAYWAIDTLDWTGKPAQRICETVLSSIYDGSIVLLHDGYEQTLQAVKMLLPALQEQGYQAVTLSQMSKAHNCPLKNGGAYIRIRKQKALL